MQELYHDTDRSYLHVGCGAHWQFGAGFHHAGERRDLGSPYQRRRLHRLVGHSTIVEYDHSGKIDHTYQINGYVDGLKFDPVTGEIWALQNQDGNSTLSIIDPEDRTVSKPLSYAVPS